MSGITSFLATSRRIKIVLGSQYKYSNVGILDKFEYTDFTSSGQVAIDFSDTIQFVYPNDSSDGNKQGSFIEISLP